MIQRLVKSYSTTFLLFVLPSRIECFSHLSLLSLSLLGVRLLMGVEGICCCWRLFAFVPFLSVAFPSSFSFVCSSRCRFQEALARMFSASTKEIGKVSFAASAPVLPLALVRRRIITQIPVAMPRHFNCRGGKLFIICRS